jgi:hypothetical protein
MAKGNTRPDKTTKNNTPTANKVKDIIPKTGNAN